MAQSATMESPVSAQGASNAKGGSSQSAQNSLLSGYQSPASVGINDPAQAQALRALAATFPDLASSKAQEQKPTHEKEFFPNAKRAWFTYYRAHRNQVVCASIGLLVAAGFLIIGFWPTLLLAVFISAGVLYGRYKDGDRRMTATVKNIASRLD